MNYIQFVKEIKSEVRNYYVVSGDDLFLLRQVEARVESACGITMPEFDKLEFDGENFSVSAFESAFVGLPIQANKKLVVVKNLPKQSDADKRALKEVLHKQNNCCVLFFSNAIGEDFSFVTDAAKIECSKLSNDLCQKFVDDRLKQNNMQITDAAKTRLVELCANNLGKISTELEKLVFMCLDKRMIEESDVKTSVKSDLEYKIYELSDLLLDKKIDRAMLIIQDMLTKKEEPTAILSLLTSNFRRLYFAKITPEDNATLAKQLGVKEYAIKIAKDKTSKVGAVALKQINEMLLETDYAIKSGEMPADLALNYAILKINSLIKK